MESDRQKIVSVFMQNTGMTQADRRASETFPAVVFDLNRKLENYAFFWKGREESFETHLIST